MKTLTTLFLLLSTIAMGQTKDIGKYMDSICKHTFIGCFILMPEKMPLINPYKSPPDDTLLLRQKRLNQTQSSGFIGDYFDELKKTGISIVTLDTSAMVVTYKHPITFTGNGLSIKLGQLRDSVQKYDDLQQWHNDYGTYEQAKAMFKAAQYWQVELDKLAADEVKARRKEQLEKQYKVKL